MTTYIEEVNSKFNIVLLKCVNLYPYTKICNISKFSTIISSSMKEYPPMYTRVRTRNSPKQI